jgi:hypothetical protein
MRPEVVPPQFASTTHSTQRPPGMVMSQWARGAAQLASLSHAAPTQVPPPVAVSQTGAEVGQREVSVGVHAAQMPFGKQSGIAAPHSAFDVQPRQVNVAVSQTGLLPVQAEVAPAVHWTHAPVPGQTGVDAEQSAEVQPRQVCAATSQMGVAPLQSALEPQPAQVPVAGSQAGVAPVHAVAFVAEHAPHVPEGWQAGVAPLHSPSASQPRQLCAVASHTGLSAGHCASDVQAMHSPDVVSQRGVASLHDVELVAEH